jgi:HSP20 family protein
MSTQEVLKRNDFLPSVFNDFFKPWNTWFDTPVGDMWGNVLSVPAVNVKENKDDFKISMAAPGMKKDDFNIDIDGNILSISAETKQEKEEKDAKYTRKEFNYSSFCRNFTLPDGVMKDKIAAGYTDGVLTLTLPKTEESRKTMAKHIAVK